MLPAFLLWRVTRLRRKAEEPRRYKAKITCTVTMGQREAAALAPPRRCDAEDTSIAQTELDALP